MKIHSAKNRAYLGLIPILGTTPSPHDLGSAYSFIKKFSAAKIVFVMLEDADRVLSRNMRLVFVGKLL